MGDEKRAETFADRVSPLRLHSSFFFVGGRKQEGQKD